MLEELCHWSQAFVFQKSHTRSSIFLFLSLSSFSASISVSFSLSLYMYVPLRISLCISVCVAFPFCLLPENQDVKFSDSPLYHDHTSMSPHHDDKGPSLWSCKQDKINAFIPKSCLGHDAFSQQQNSKIIDMFYTAYVIKTLFDYLEFYPILCGSNAYRYLLVDRSTESYCFQQEFFELWLHPYPCSILFTGDRCDTDTQVYSLQTIVYIT